MKVFISHTSSDHDFVWKLAKRLKEDGVDVWVDEWEIKVGDSIVQKVNDALIESSFLLIILSENSLNSDWVLKEMNVGLMRQLSSKNVKILPVLLELRSRDLPPLLADIYAVRFSRETINDTEYRKLLEPIIKKRSSDIMNEYQDKFFENVQHIDLIIEKEIPTGQEVSFVLSLIQEEHYYNYFFRKVDKIHWFNPLKARGYFGPSEKTRPIEIEEKREFMIPFWPVLDYLVKVSEKTIEPENALYADELLSIIRRITDYHVKTDRSLDNFRTWHSFIKILKNIPNEKINMADLRLCKEWLFAKFGTDIHGADLVRKLLPKFLDSENIEDHEKAEYIVKISTEISWNTDAHGRLIKRGKKKIPTTTVDPYWLLRSIDRNVGSIAEKFSNNILLHLSDRIVEILDSERDTTWRQLSHEKQEIIIIGGKNDSSNFSITIGTIVQDENQKSDRFSLDYSPPDYNNKYEFQISDCFSRYDFVEKFNIAIDQKHEYSFLHGDFQNEYKKIYEALFEDYSYIRFPSLYENPRTGKSDPEITLIKIFRDIISEKIKIDPDGLRPMLEDLLGNRFKYPIFKRILLYSIGKQYQDYKDLFIKILSGADELRLFENSNYQPELFELLSRNVQQFGAEEKKIIDDLLKQGPQFYLPEEDQNKYKIYWRIKWLAPLKSDPYFGKLLNEYKEIENIDEDKIRYKSETMTRSGPGPSPISIEQMDQMAVQELSNYLQKFKTKDDWDGPTVGGLATLLKQAVINRPEKYINCLSAFLPCGYIYIYEILSAFKEIWNKQQQINWEKILAFINSYISQPGYWEDQFVVERGKWLSSADSLWVASITAELLQDGLREDSFAIPFEHMPNSEIVLIEILNRLNRDDEESEIKDFVSYSLNTVVGKSLTALILLSLRIKRNPDTSPDYRGNTWESGLKIVYEKFLVGNFLESYTWLGRYAPGFYYLDKEWFLHWANRIQEIIGSTEWTAFMGGYFSIGLVYDDLYILLRESYLYGLENKFPDEHDNEYIVQHIGLSYLQGKENLSDDQSLIRLLIKRWEYPQILDLIDFFSMQRDEDSQFLNQIKPHILQFWKYLFENKIKAKPSQEYTNDEIKLLSRLSRLTGFLDSINEESYSWLVQTARFVHEGYNSSFFIESLDSFQQQDSLKYVGLLYIEMLKKHTPDFDKKHIQSTVHKLYESGHKETANIICDEYGKHGYEFLREVYEKNNR